MSNILIGVTGGIAAYKVPVIARLLIKKGHSVKFMMTQEALKFIGHTSLAAISGNKVSYPENYEDDSIDHIKLAKWADICLIAPATANTIGKYASGIADSSFLATLLALTCPLVMAPAMNCKMFSHPAVSGNINKIKSWGTYIIEPDDGFLACGDNGKGRMREPEYIAEFVCGILDGNNKNVAVEQNTNICNTDSEKIKCMVENFNKSSLEEYLDNDEGEETLLEGLGYSKPLEGVKFLITAGPTKEYIDPVRYISNKSSGKMGYALAHAALELGADVVLISGETNLVSKVPDTVYAVSCSDMAEAVQQRISQCDILIMAAAVSDYSPANIATEKIKKTDNVLRLDLVKNIDILKQSAENKRDGQIFIGFAAETENLEANAQKKLAEKKLDLVVANDVSRDDIGFDSDYNEVKLFFRDGKITETGKRLKKDIARIIVTESAILLKGGN